MRKFLAAAMILAVCLLTNHNLNHKLFDFSSRDDITSGSYFEPNPLKIFQLSRATLIFKIYLSCLKSHLALINF